ncbi:MAG: hypothetical protein M5U26_29290 [Planctomycetota bacterium]|nr:hypothetical protein [Planctomycetota bacterium]
MLPRAPRRLRPAAVLALLLFCAPAGSARADIVILKNGKSLEGRVVEDGDAVVVHLSFGTVRIARDRIEKIVAKKTPLDEYHERAAALDVRFGPEAAGAEAGAMWFELAGWCGQRELPRQREEALKRVIALDPGHEAAREALGYVRVGERWVSGDERQEALGLVRYNGQWVTPEARDEAERRAEDARRKDLVGRIQEADLRLKQAQAEKTEAERALLDTKARQDEQERRRLDAEWAALERERSRLYYDRYNYPYYSYPPVLVAPSRPRPPGHAPPAPPAPAKPPAAGPRPPTTSPTHNNGTGGLGFPHLSFGPRD